MADNLEIPSFGIEETLEMGAGNTKLIEDFLSPETSTEKPENIKPIIEEANKKVDAPKEGEDDEKKPSAQEYLNSFLDNEEKKDDGTSSDKDNDKKQTSPEEEKTEEPGETQFGALANDLFKLGVFVKDEDEEVSINNAEDFLDRFNLEKKKGAIEIVDNFISQFGEDYKRAFDAIFVKGVDPNDYFGTYNSIVSFADLDMTNEENQIAVIKRALSDQGYETEDITKEIERLKNYGDLEPVATTHHKVLIKKEAAKLQQKEADAERELQQRVAYKDQYIQNVKTILQEKVKAKEYDGIPINPKIAAELHDFLLVDKWKTASGETLTDFDRTILELKKPENHAKKVKIALLLKTLEKDPTLSTIQKSGLTKQADQLFTSVTKQVNRERANNTQDKQHSWFL